MTPHAAMFLCHATWKLLFGWCDAVALLGVLRALVPATLLDWAWQPCCDPPSVLCLAPDCTPELARDLVEPLVGVTIPPAARLN